MKTNHKRKQNTKQNTKLALFVEAVQEMEVVMQQKDKERIY